MIHNCRSWPARAVTLITLSACLVVPVVSMAQQMISTRGPIDSIVAQVDDDVILRSELDLAVAGIVDRVRASGESMPPMHLLEGQVLERLIIRELQIQRAMQTGIRISDADIDQALVALAQQNNMTVQKMRQVIEADGEDFSEFRRNIGEELMTERLRQRIVNGMDPITDTEVDILLASEDLAGGEYNVSHIMVSVADGSTPTQISEAQAKQAVEVVMEYLKDKLPEPIAGQLDGVLEGDVSGLGDLTGGLGKLFG